MSSKSGRRLLIAAPVLALSLSSCGVSFEEYKRFAEAGKNYATAMDSLLTVSADTYINANSETLLDANTQIPEYDRIKYTEAKEVLKAYLRTIALAKQHTQLLQQYFQALQDLATTDAPEKSLEASTKIFNQLTKVGSELSQRPIFGEDARQAYSQVPQLIISAKIKGALRAELMARKETIYKELITQELAQRLLSQQITSDLKNINSFRENRTIKPAYVSVKPIPEPDKWIALRSEISKAAVSAEALNDAAKTSKALQKAFAELLSDKLTVARANSLLNDIRDLAKVVREIQSANQPQQ